MGRKENKLWGLSVFFLDSPKSFLPKMKRKLKKEIGASFLNKNVQLQLHMGFIHVSLLHTFFFPLLPAFFFFSFYLLGRRCLPLLLFLFFFFFLLVYWAGLSSFFFFCFLLLLLLLLFCLDVFFLWT